MLEIYESCSKTLKWSIKNFAFRIETLFPYFDRFLLFRISNTNFIKIYFKFEIGKVNLILKIA